MSASPDLLPTNRDENWRYANLRPLAKAAPDAVGPSQSLASPALPPVLPGYERWSFVDGHFSPPLSGVAHDSAASLMDFREAGLEIAKQLDSDLAQAGTDFSLARINLQRESKVLYVRVPDGAEARLELNFIAATAASVGTSYPRVQVHAGRGSRVSIVERHLSAHVRDPAINAAFDLALGRDATLDHCRLQNCANGASVFDTLTAHVGERAMYRLRAITLGGLSSRSTQFVTLAGRAASCELTVASVANEQQTHDFFAQIEHAGPATRTRELYRGIATGRGKLGFNGKMIVRADAVDADSDQSLRTLLAGNGAEAAVRPQLEIYTDKVRAKHGATIGKLDDQMLFYLLSRGLDRSQAQALLQWAFIEDAISQVELAALRQEIEQLIAPRLNDVSALGNVSRLPLELP
jgi:Fe-S cluster assembly protein SufD